MQIKKSEKPYQKFNFKHELPLFYELTVQWGTKYQVVGGLGKKLNFDNKQDLLLSINELINQESNSNLTFLITLTINQNDKQINTWIYRENNNLFIGEKTLCIINNVINEKAFSKLIDELTK